MPPKLTCRPQGQLTSDALQSSRLADLEIETNIEERERQASQSVESGACGGNLLRNKKQKDAALTSHANSIGLNRPLPRETERYHCVMERMG